VAAAREINKMPADPHSTNESILRAAGITTATERADRSVLQGCRGGCTRSRYDTGRPPLGQRVDLSGDWNYADVLHQNTREICRPERRANIHYMRVMRLLAPGFSCAGKCRKVVERNGGGNP
jgi:hypothetical protein